MDTASEFHAKAPQAIVSEGLAQGLYVAARTGFEPTTLRTKGDKSTNETPLPTSLIYPLISSISVLLITDSVNGTGGAHNNEIYFDPTVDSKPQSFS